MAEPRRRREELEELGAPGTTIYSGFITGEEYNADLQGSQALAVYDRMRRSDGQVQAILRAIKLPILGAEWKVDPADPAQAGQAPDPLDQEIAAFVEQARTGMSISWQDYLRQVLLCLDFGFMCFEIVYTLGEEGRIRWRKFAPRLPRTIWKWNVERDGGLRSVTQFVFVPDGQGSGNYQYPEIPVERLLRFTLDQEGSNFEGIGLLRAAYKHWFLKNQLERIDAIKHERWGVGIPFVKLPQGFTPADKTLAIEIAESLRAHEKAYVVYPDNYEVGLLSQEGQKTGTDALPSIKYHDEMIARSVLAMMIVLGTTETGARALGETFQDTFVTFLETVVGLVEDVHTRFAIPRLVDQNWRTERYPRLRGSLKRADIDRAMQSLTQLASPGLITPDPELEAHLRRMLNLPQRQRPTPRPAPQLSDHAGRFWREPWPHEECIALTEIDDYLDQAEETLLRRVAPVRDQIVRDLIDQLVAADLEQIPEVRPRYLGKLAAQIRPLLQEVAAFGRRQVQEEMARQAPAGAEPRRLQDDRENPFRRPRFEKGELQDLWRRIFAYEGQLTPEALQALLQEWFGVKGVYIARKMTGRLGDVLVDETLRQRRAGLTGDALRLALERAESELADLGLRAAASIAINDSFGLGRLQEATLRSNVIEKEIYSAILDRKTCEVCRPLDGKEGPVGTFVTPNPDCLGGDRCRCITAYVRRTATVPEAA